MKKARGSARVLRHNDHNDSDGQQTRPPRSRAAEKKLTWDNSEDGDSSGGDESDHFEFDIRLGESRGMKERDKFNQRLFIPVRNGNAKKLTLVQGSVLGSDTDGSQQTGTNQSLRNS